MAEIAPQFLEVGGRPHLLQRQHVGIKGPDHRAQCRLGCLRFGIGRPVNAVNPGTTETPLADQIVASLAALSGKTPEEIKGTKDVSNNTQLGNPNEMQLETTKNETALAEEAKNYKSAEEFVKAQEITRKEIAQEKVPTAAFINGARNMLPEIKFFL